METSSCPSIRLSCLRQIGGRLFECRNLGAIELKGLPEPVPAWRQSGETGRRSDGSNIFGGTVQLYAGHHVLRSRLRDLMTGRRFDSFMKL
jgi:hypothetical protein